MTYERTPLEEIIAKYEITGIHPLANAFPLLNDKEFQDMCEDVAKNGFTQPITINGQGLLLDGRNRLQVAWATKVEPLITRLNPEDEEAYIVSQNVHRRHLTLGQRAFV